MDIPQPPPPSPLIPPPPDRRWWWIGGGIAAALIVVIVLVLALAGGDDDTSVTTGTTDSVPAFSVATTVATTTAPTTAAPTTEAPTTAPSTVPPTTAAETTVAETTSTTVAERPVSVLVAGETGIVEITGGQRTVLAGDRASVAVELDGTVYFQTSSARVSPEGDGPDTAIHWIDPSGVKTLLTPAQGESLVLHDGAIAADGHPKLLYSIWRGYGPPAEGNDDPESEQLYLYDVTTASSTVLGEIGGWEYGTSRLTLAADIVVGTWSAEASHGLLLYDHAGVDRSDPAKYSLDSEYFDCNDCPLAFGTDALGGRLAWVDNGRLIVVDRASAAQLNNVPVPPDYYRDLRLSGHWVLLNRFELPALLVDLNTGAITELADLGAASFS